MSRLFLTGNNLSAQQVISCCFALSLAILFVATLYCQWQAPLDCEPLKSALEI
ncbi:MAG TPA: hypothetical protein VJJ83_00595 [Candidatus Babeliales bacterium]|nr:hypothetical protein [Candidatus Babeliales bacterium]